MKLKINIWGVEETYSIYCNEETQDFTIGEHQLPYSSEFMNRVINLIKDWPDDLEDNEKHDGIKYKIAYEVGKHQRVITANNKTPDNFYSLIYLINKYKPKTRKEVLDTEYRLYEIKKLLEKNNIDVGKLL